MKKLAHFFEKYEKTVGIVLLVGGFIFDNLLLVRPDNFRDNVSFMIFLGGSALSIFFYNLYKEGTKHSVAFFVMQFGLGGLFSMSLVFYSRGATFGASWPFLLMLAFYLIGNEFFKKRYEILLTQLGALFIALFSYLIFIVPVLVHRINEWVFLLSGALSLIIIAFFIDMIWLVNRKEVMNSRRSIIITILSIFVGINIFYFTNLIPPIPLLLKDAGVYHSVIRNGSVYEVSEEQSEATGLSKVISYFKTPTIHIVGSNPVYIFSSVFAPVALNTNLKHVWQHYDTKTKKWVTTTTVTIPIVGGRNDGYRMFSLKTDIDGGLWRVDITTSRGQIIGRTKFNVEKVNTEPSTVTIAK